MSKVDELKSEIERLPTEEFSELVRWLSEKDWERWDKQIEADSEAGKLDFLEREALEIYPGRRCAMPWADMFCPFRGDNEHSSLSKLIQEVTKGFRRKVALSNYCFRRYSSIPCFE